MAFVTLRPLSKRIHRSLEEAKPQTAKTTVKFDPKHVAIVHQLASLVMQNTSQIWDFDPAEHPSRPIIHTFYQPLYRNIVTKENAATLAVWKHAWEQAGWNPRVLSLKDVEKHPNFDVLNTIVRQFRYNEYETYCYLRYFAMATVDVGGGFMSDFDTLPTKGMNMLVDDDNNTNFTLPHNGVFTSYSGYVPALLAGSASEWNRVGLRIVEEATKHYRNYKENGGTFSDMLALEQVSKEFTNKNKIAIQKLPRRTNCFGKCYMNIYQESGSIQTMGMGSTNNVRIDCDLLQNQTRVIHVSHHSMKDTRYPTDQRPVMMAKVMDVYHTACDGPDFFASAAKKVKSFGSSSSSTLRQLKRQK